MASHSCWHSPSSNLHLPWALTPVTRNLQVGVSNHRNSEVKLLSSNLKLIVATIPLQKYLICIFIPSVAFQLIFTLSDTTYILVIQIFLFHTVIYIVCCQFYLLDSLWLQTNDSVCATLGLVQIAVVFLRAWISVQMRSGALHRVWSKADCNRPHGGADVPWFLFRFGFGVSACGASAHKSLCQHQTMISTPPHKSMRNQ